LNIGWRQALQPNAADAWDQINPDDLRITLMGLRRDLCPGSGDPKVKPFADRHPARIDVVAFIDRPQKFA
jgi:hypothetical protein